MDTYFLQSVSSNCSHFDLYLEHEHFVLYLEHDDHVALVEDVAGSVDGHPGEVLDLLWVPDDVNQVNCEYLIM